MNGTRRLLAREVVQSSSLDCGPAALKCLLDSHGIDASYGRLREACQTDVDGTSIDALEDVARQLGLDVEQCMQSPDHLLMAETDALPAIVIVRLPDGATHFVVAWRRVGNVLQLMDPAVGRRWASCRAFLDELYLHTQPVSAAAWREWAGSESFLAPLRTRLSTLGAEASRLLDGAAGNPHWQPLAALDAATRMTATMVAAGAMRAGAAAGRTIESLSSQPDSIPDTYWSVRPHGETELALRGAVLVRAIGVAAPRPVPPASPELAAALTESPPRPGLGLLRMLLADGVMTPVAVLLALALAAGSVLIEALLFRGFLDLGLDLGLSGQRLGAIAALMMFLIARVALEGTMFSALRRSGRHVEIRLRLAFLRKVPRLGDRYLRSRLQSDMAERCQSVHRIRTAPELGARALRAALEIVCTTVAIIWLDPRSAVPALMAAACGLAIPLSFQPAIAERDLRVRSHSGALCRFYLDALRGLVPIRVHGAERSVRRGHGQLLAEWARAGLRRQELIVWTDVCELAVGFGLVAWLVVAHAARHGEAGSILLLVYWALNLPVLSQDLTQAVRQYPTVRNLALRLMEPLGALEEPAAPAATETSTRGRSDGVSIRFQNVGVRAAGRTILTGIDLEIGAGTHMAIVGASGAGKSSLVGLLLGWHRPSDGTVLVDGDSLDGRLDRLRRQTAWIDPAVQLWNESFYRNLQYGSDESSSTSIAHIVDAAELAGTLERLPDGLETVLGEGGALVSGGEGQRVRIGRAMARPDARLVILDEAFRGLDCEQRRLLLGRSRRLWAHATLLCITHDIAATSGFDRVVVLDEGRVVEEGRPRDLMAKPGSRYRDLLDADRDVRDRLWTSDTWRRLRLDGGQLHGE